MAELTFSVIDLSNGAVSPIPENWPVLNKEGEGDPTLIINEKILGGDGEEIINLLIAPDTKLSGEPTEFTNNTVIFSEADNSTANILMVFSSVDENGLPVWDPRLQHSTLISGNTFEFGTGGDTVVLSDADSNTFNMGEGNDYVVLARSDSNIINMDEGNDIVDLLSSNNNTIDLGFGGNSLTLQNSNGNNVTNSGEMVRPMQLLYSDNNTIALGRNGINLENSDSNTVTSLAGRLNLLNSDANNIKASTDFSPDELLSTEPLIAGNLIGSIHNNVIKLSDGKDILKLIPSESETANMTDNTIWMRNGDDVLSLSGGIFEKNLFRLGEGHDTVDIFYQEVKSNPVVFAKENTMYFGKGDDVLNVFIDEEGDPNTLPAGFLDYNGFSGNEVRMGSGNDILNMAYAGDLKVEPGQENMIRMGIGDDTATLYSSEKNILKMGPGQDAVTLNESDANVVHTGIGNDFAELNASNNNTLKMADGQDVALLIGSEGNIIRMGSGDDVLRLGKSSFNDVRTGEGNDEISLDISYENDVRTGKGNDEIILQKSHENVIRAGEDDDILILSVSTGNEIRMNAGQDTVYLLNSEGNIIHAGAENDLIKNAYEVDVGQFVEGSIIGDTVKLGTGNDIFELTVPETLEITSAVFYGGQGQDVGTLSVLGGRAVGNTIHMGNGNDELTIMSDAGTVSKNTIHLGSDADTLTVTVNDPAFFTGNAFYGGKGDDVFNLNLEGVTENLVEPMFNKFLGGEGLDTLVVNNGQNIASEYDATNGILTHYMTVEGAGGMDQLIHVGETTVVDFESVEIYDYVDNGGGVIV